jgi:hypothetical protein
LSLFRNKKALGFGRLLIVFLFCSIVLQLRFSQASLSKFWCERSYFSYVAIDEYGFLVLSTLGNGRIVEKEKLYDSFVDVPLEKT